MTNTNSIKKIKQKRNRKKGFTLIELTVVLAIMALIITVIAPNFSDIKDGAQSKVDEQNCSVVERTVEMLLAEDVIDGSADADITITPSENGVISSNISGISDSNAKDDLANLLYDLSKPQNGDSYLVEIRDGKKVNAITGNASGL